MVFDSGLIIAVPSLEKPYKILLFFWNILLLFGDIDYFQEVFSLFYCQVVYKMTKYKGFCQSFSLLKQLHSDFIRNKLIPEPDYRIILPGGKMRLI